MRYASNETWPQRGAGKARRGTGLTASPRVPAGLARWLRHRPGAAACVLLACGLVAWPETTAAIGEDSYVVLAQLKYKGNWDVRPDPGRRLMWEVVKRTAVEAQFRTQVVEAQSPDLFRYPLLYMCGDSEFPPFSEADRKRIRRHIEFGGLLIADDCVGQEGAGFDKSFRREVGALFPKRKLERLPTDHSVYRSFYLVRDVVGRLANKPYLEGIDIDDRTAVIYSRNDLAGAWAYDPFGNWEYEVLPGGDTQREWAIRLGVNLVVYALTVNYKKDQVHVPFILRRWRRGE